MLQPGFVATSRARAATVQAHNGIALSNEKGRPKQARTCITGALCPPAARRRSESRAISSRASTRLFECSRQRSSFVFDSTKTHLTPNLQKFSLARSLLPLTLIWPRAATRIGSDRAQTSAPVGAACEATRRDAPHQLAGRAARRLRRHCGANWPDRYFSTAPSFERLS